MVTGTTHGGNGSRAGRHWLNLFEITNRTDLSLAYRLLEVQGLPPGEPYDKNLNRLVKTVSYEMRRPVALVRGGRGHALAIPADAAPPGLEQQLMPHVATLVPGPDTYPLDFTRLDATSLPIAVEFLRFALRTPLLADEDLWGGGRAWYYKQPLNRVDARATVDLYPGFVWNVVATAGGRLFLAPDTVVRYVDRRWLPERLNGNDPRPYLRRHCLYHFGRQWYMVQLWGVTGLTVAEQRFSTQWRRASGGRLQLHAGAVACEHAALGARPRPGQPGDHLSLSGQ